MARVRSTARVTRDGEEAEATETAPISEVMKRSGLIVTESACDEEAPAAEAEQTDIEEGDAREGEIDYDIIMPSKHSHLDFGKSTVSEADMTMMTKLFQKKKEPSIAKKAAGPKKWRIITVIEAIEGTPWPASASKAPAVESATAIEAAPAKAATAEAELAEDANLESTLSNIDKILLDMATEEVVATAKETMATVPEKEKEMAEDASKEENFNFQNLIGQEYEKEELREYAISCGYQPGALLFGGVDDERLGCLRDQTERRLSVLYQRVLVSRSLKQTLAATDDNISSIVYSIPISR
jgi:hypothetical protein